MTSRIDFNSPSMPAGIASANSAQQDQVTGPSFAAELKKAQANGDDKKLKEACRELESVLVYQLIRSMRATVPKSDVMGNSMGMDIYEQMLDEKYAQEIATSGAFGLADTMYAQLTNTAPPARTVATPPPPVKSANTQKSKTADNLNEIIKTTAARYHLDERLLHAVIKTESNYDPRALSSAGAQGLMQLMPATAKSLGVDNPWDPQANVDGGARYLRQMLDRYHGSLSLALAAYNAGPGAVDRYNGIPPFRETRQYVERVIGLFKKST